MFVTAILFGVGLYFTERPKNRWFYRWGKNRAIVIISIIVAITSVSVNVVSKSIEKPLSRPSIIIQTLKEKNEIEILIKTKGLVDRISLKYPILGNITDFQDLNDVTDASTILAKAVGGVTQNDVLNNFQMIITDIKPDVVLHYKFFYRPSFEGIEIAGTDRYELVYAWEYYGDKIQETEWRTIKGDNSTVKPNVEIKGFKIFNKALTPEEVKKLYEDGISQIKF